MSETDESRRILRPEVLAEQAWPSLGGPAVGADDPEFRQTLHFPEPTEES